MKRIVWSTMFALAAPVIASCGRSQPESPDTASPDQSQAESDAPGTSDQTTAEQPDSEALRSKTSGGRVAEAVGKALLKSFTAGAEEEAPPAPAFKSPPE